MKSAVSKPEMARMMSSKFIFLACKKHSFIIQSLVAIFREALLEGVPEDAGSRK